MVTRPPVFQQLTQAQLLARIEADLTTSWPGYANLRDTDPARIITNIMAAHTQTALLYMDARLTSVFVSTAIGNDLDAVAGMFTVTRNEGESDDGLRLRIRAAIADITPPGSAARDRIDALSADSDVMDVAFIRQANLVINIYILSKSGVNHAPSATLNATVLAYLNDPTRKAVSRVNNIVDPTITPYFLAISTSFDQTLTTEAAYTRAFNDRLGELITRQTRLGLGVKQDLFYRELSTLTGYVSMTITRMTTDSTNLTAVSDLADPATDNIAYFCPTANRAVTVAVSS